MKKQVLIMFASLTVAFLCVWAIAGWFGVSNSENAEATGYSNPFSEAVDGFFDDGNAKLRTTTNVVTENGIDYIVQESTTISGTITYTFKQVFFLDTIEGRSEYYPDYFLFEVTFNDDPSAPLTVSFDDQYIDGSLETVFINGEPVDGTKLSEWQIRYTDELDTALDFIQS